MRSANWVGVFVGILFASCSSAPSALAASADIGDNLQVAITNGTIQGVSDGDVQYFKGIPFAAPPVGDLRWKAPQPVQPWQGVRDASQFGHDCMQQAFPMDAAPQKASFSEDCLYLNVWRPAGGGKNLPVMVWIYGGGFVNGGTSSAVYDGSHFADKGVIFVSVNYRLGRFGFFGFPALMAEDPNGLHGNFGYMDQIAALQWVKANIAAFGGNPDNVMVFGESAGGGSVHVLLTSPLAKGLFNKAGIESGGGREHLTGVSLTHVDLPALDAIGVNFAKGQGAPAYEYRFSYVSPLAEKAMGAGPFAGMGMKGAQHASEIPYVFDTVKASPGGAAPEDEAMAKKVNAYWVNFAKMADPNGAGLPQWPAYSAKPDALMNFTQEEPKAMVDPWGARLDLVAKHADDAAR